MNDEEKDAIENDLAFTPGALLGGLLTLLFTGAFLVATSPIWVPGLIIHKIKHRNDPKPKRRGTVRPMRGPIN